MLSKYWKIEQGLHMTSTEHILYVKEKGPKPIPKINFFGPTQLNKFLAISSSIVNPFLVDFPNDFGKNTPLPTFNR